MEKSIVLNVISIENSKALKSHTFSMKQQFFLLFVTSATKTTMQYLKKMNLFRY